MSPAKRKEAGRKGGKKAQASGKGHRWTQESATAAGRLGGIAKAAKE